MAHCIPSEVKPSEPYRFVIMDYGSSASIIVFSASLETKTLRKSPAKKLNNILREQFNPMSEKKEGKKEGRKEEKKDKWFSPIPKHLSDKEREKWEKDLEWETQERKRREKEGFYPSEDSAKTKNSPLVKRLIKNESTQKKRGKRR